MVVTILVAALLAMTPGNLSPSSGPVELGGGGPDQFGYRYLDSDTTCPGAPVFNWVSIKGIGTEITTLGDDNVAGPFPLGFTFPYYWYGVTQCHVGSNGYIAFHDNAMNASPFQHIPSPARSNNTLACLMSDIDCSNAGSPNGSVWYWTNAAADTFIVEYDSIAFWSTGGNNTFQIIVSKPDSSITYQYKEQTGSPFNGWAPDNNQTGIENVSGAIGLSYLSGTIPPANMYAPNLAVRFYPPESTSLQVHDAGIQHSMNEWSGGMFAPNNRPIPLWAIARNYGNQAEAAFKVYMKVTRVNGTVLFTDSAMTPALNPGDVDSINFLSYTPTAVGTYFIKTYTRLTGDMFAGNDSAKIELRVVTLPAELKYVDSAYSAMYWNGPGGFGNRFIPPVLPCSVSALKVWAQSAAGVTIHIAIYDDDGPGGGIGTEIDGGDLAITTGWHTLTLSRPAVISSGVFYVGATSQTSSDPSFGMDSVPPLSYQGWEYTGVWAPGRDAAMRDVCISCVATGTVGVEELTPAPVPMPVRIDVNPNPFGATAVLRVLNPRGTEKSIEVYDATGSGVRTVALERGQAVFDGRLLADGVYFARIAGREAPVAKLIVSH
jgi:hypothetical protein